MTLTRLIQGQVVLSLFLLQSRPAPTWRGGGCHGPPIRLPTIHERVKVPEILRVPSGELKGKITDESQREISDVAISASRREDGSLPGSQISPTETTSNIRGDYVFSSLITGTYLLCAKAEAYKESCVSIPVRAGHNRRNFKLQRRAKS